MRNSWEATVLYVQVTAMHPITKFGLKIWGNTEWRFVTLAGHKNRPGYKRSLVSLPELLCQPSPSRLESGNIRLESGKTFHSPRIGTEIMFYVGWGKLFHNWKSPSNINAIYEITLYTCLFLVSKFLASVYACEYRNITFRWPHLIRHMAVCHFNKLNFEEDITSRGIVQVS